MYVLDAGNARVLVYNDAGEYVTEWGTRGTAEGLFDFGDDLIADWTESLRVSLVVDDEGFVYVADPGNDRTQVFAP